MQGAGAHLQAVYSLFSDDMVVMLNDGAAVQEGQFYLDASNPRFSTCSELVRHYMRNCLPRETVMLMTPYSTVMLTKADGAVADTEAATYNQV